MMNYLYYPILDPSLFDCSLSITDTARMNEFDRIYRKAIDEHYEYRKQNVLNRIRPLNLK